MNVSLNNDLPKQTAIKNPGIRGFLFYTEKLSPQPQLRLALGLLK